MYLWKLCSWEKDTFTIKRGHGVKDLSSCTEETHIWGTDQHTELQFEVNTIWLLHSQSTLPVPQLDPSPSQPTMLEVVCYPCHWRERIYAQKRAPVSYPYIYPTSQIHLQQGLYQNVTGSQESKECPRVFIILVKIHAHSSDTVNFVILYQNQLVIGLHIQKAQLLSWNYFFSIQCPNSMV